MATLTKNATVKAKGKKSDAPLVTPAPKADPAPVASKYKGRTSGMRVMEFQDASFQANGKAMLTDAELAAAWREEFPGAVAFQEFHVKGARRDYNAGRHAKATPKPDVPLDEAVIVNGKRVWASTVAKAPAPKAAKAEAAVTAEPKAAVVKVKKTKTPKAA